MTVATDLQLRTGANRRLVCRIDGLNYDFWQPHETAPPSTTTNNVTWTTAVNVSTSTNNLTKNAGGNAWNGGAVSNETISTDGYVEWTTSENDARKMCGLSNGDTDQNFTDIDFAIYADENGAVRVYEGGTERVAASAGWTYSAGDTFRVQVIGSTVTYYHNGTLIWTSAGTPTFPLLVDTSLFHDGTTPSVVSTVEGVTLSTTGGWRTALECLELGGEVSAGLDVRSLKADTSGLTIKLRNIYDTTPAKVSRVNDPNTTYLLPQIFAPGRAASGAIAHMRFKTVKWLKPGDTTIYTDLNTDFSASGEAYIGGETISYTGLGTDGALYTFTNVTRGLHPCIGTAAAFTGRSIFYDPYETEGHTGGLAVTQYPSTQLGKRAALYVVTLQADGTWPDFSAAELLWAGYVTDSITYSPQTGTFDLSCRSLMDWLAEREVGSELKTAHIRGINLEGGDFLDFNGEIELISGGTMTFSASFSGTVPSGFYETPIELANKVAAAIAGAASAPGGGMAVGGGGITDGKTSLTFGYNVTNTVLRVWSPNGRPNVAFHALGFPIGSQSSPSMVVAPDNGMFTAFSPEAPFVSFHSLDRRVNGDTLYTTFRQEDFITDQGDWGAAAASRGHVLVQMADGGGAVASYIGNGAATPDSLTLDPIQPRQTGPLHVAGHRLDENPAQVRQVYFTENRFQGKGAARGPFEALLYPLLSTGQTDGAYNGSYDSMAPQYAIGMQDDLVDTQSFLDADALLSTKALAQRTYYVVLQSTTPWMDLVMRECKLLGFALVQARGKLKLVRLPLKRADTYIETLTEGKNAQVDEMPPATLSSDAIVNAWEVKMDYDAGDDELADRKIKIVDQNSVDALGATHALEIEHPGLRDLPIPDVDLVTAITDEFRSWHNFFAFPNYRVDITLAPTLINRIAVGDVVRWQSTMHPDPYGSGSMTTDALALVVDYEPSWTGDMAWTARVGLLVFCAFDALLLTPWAPAALVTAWDDDTDTLTLAEHAFGASATDNEDGETFENGDQIRIVWTHPTDPTSGQSLGPFAVDSYTAATNALALSGTPDLSTLTSGREYIVVPADWGAVQASQETTGLWMASKTGLKLGTDLGQRYG